jgi:hypothetical protein
MYIKRTVSAPEYTEFCRPELRGEQVNILRVCMFNLLSEILGDVNAHIRHDDQQHVILAKIFMIFPAQKPSGPNIPTAPPLSGVLCIQNIKTCIETFADDVITRGKALPLWPADTVRLLMAQFRKSLSQFEAMYIENMNSAPIFEQIVEKLKAEYMALLIEFRKHYGPNAANLMADYDIYAPLMIQSNNLVDRDPKTIVASCRDRKISSAHMKQILMYRRNLSQIRNAELRYITCGCASQMLPFNISEIMMIQEHKLQKYLINFANILNEEDAWIIHLHLTHVLSPYNLISQEVMQQVAVSIMNNNVQNYYSPYARFKDQSGPQEKICDDCNDCDGEDVD